MPIKSFHINDAPIDQGFCFIKTVSGERLVKLVRRYEHIAGLVRQWRMVVADARGNEHDFPIEAYLRPVI